MVDEGEGKGTVVVVGKKKERVEPKVKKVEEKEVAQTKVGISEGVLVYTSTPEDRLWANGGMVAKVVSGDSSLSIQQRLEDAGFNNVVVTLMGSDRVFLYCTGDADIWNVFNEALHFFGMMFSNIHKWVLDDEKYERGAWIRIYGTPAHAWNESFFKICASGCGRYIRSDDCTVDRARLDNCGCLFLPRFWRLLMYHLQCSLMVENIC